MALLTSTTTMIVTPPLSFGLSDVLDIGGVSPLSTSGNASPPIDKLDDVADKFSALNTGRPRDNGTPSIHSDRASPKSVFDVGKMEAVTPSDYVRQAARANQFLLFGESHDSPRTRVFMASMIKTLKEEGFSFLAIEVDHQDQRLVDEYARTGNKAVLAGHWWINDEYIEILDAARSHGLKLVCIDDAYFHDERDGLRRLKVNKVMFRHLKEVCLDQEPEAKVAVYIGAGHIYKSKLSLGALLETYAPRRSHSVKIIDTRIGFDDSWEMRFANQIGRNLAFFLDPATMEMISREKIAHHPYLSPEIYDGTIVI